MLKSGRKYQEESNEVLRMNINERENLKKKIEADLLLLAEESWDIEVSSKISLVHSNLINIDLEGYDD